jgi:hypothetical protein
MPKAFDSWQVFGHKPIEKLEANLWRVEGELPGNNGTRVMTIAKMRDGGLLIHNGIALEEPLMKEIEAFGRPSVLVVPNGFHRLDSKVYKQRYPQLKVVAPAGSRKKVEQVVKCDADYANAPRDEDVKLHHWEGTKDAEGLLEVKSGGSTTIVVNDVINNLPKMGGLFGFLLAPTGVASVPRLARWMIVKNKPAFTAHVEKYASSPSLKRVIVSHGAVISDRPGETLREVTKRLNG